MAATFWDSHARPSGLRSPAADNYFKLLSNIMEGESPVVPEADFSDEISEFVQICLDKDPRRRPSANDLLKHPWLRQTQPDDLLLSGLLSSMAL